MGLNLDIKFYSDDNSGAKFECSVTGKTYLLTLESSEGYGDMILLDTDRDREVMRFKSNYKTKRSTLIAKCLEYFENNEDHHTGIAMRII